MFTNKLLEVILPNGSKDDTSKLTHIFLVLELIDYDLRKLLESSKLRSFSEEYVKVVIYNLLCALNFIHSANLIHRDLKPSNIMIDSECKISLCDFGLSRCNV